MHLNLPFGDKGPGSLFIGDCGCQGDFGDCENENTQVFSVRFCRGPRNLSLGDC